MIAEQDATEVVKAVLEDGRDAATPEVSDALAVLESRLDRVRLLGGRFTLVGMSPRVAGMLKVVGRARLAH